MSNHLATLRFTSLSPHSGLFIAGFVCAHLAALGVAYAAALINAQSHELPANASGHQAVHHLGRMTLIQLQAPPRTAVFPSMDPRQ